MGNRGKDTFQKRKKELARKEKQERKAERRAQRKLDGDRVGEIPSLEEEAASEMEPAEMDPNHEPLEA